MAMNSSSNETYPDLFCSYVMRSAEYALQCVQQATTNLSTYEQELGMHTLSFTVKLAEVWPVTRPLLLTMAQKMEHAGDPNSWIVYLEGGIEQSKKLGDAEAQADIQSYLGVLYKDQARYDDARHQLEASATYFEQAGNPHNQARALSSWANVARRQRDFKEATRLAHTALRLSEGAKERQAHSYLILGTIAYDQRAWQDAYDFFKKALTLWEEINNQRMIAWALTNMGAALWGLEKYEDAINHYERAIKVFEKKSDPVHEGVARMNLGNVYLKLDRFTKALAFYLEAELIFHKTQDKLHLAMVNTNKAMAYHNLQKWDKAKDAWLFSIEQWQRIGNVRFLINAIDGLGSVYLQQELYDKALLTFQDALNWLAQIENDPSYNRLFDMVTTHLRAAKEQRGL